MTTSPNLELPDCTALRNRVQTSLQPIKMYVHFFPRHETDPDLYGISDFSDTIILSVLKSTADGKNKPETFRQIQCSMNQLGHC